MRSAPKITPKFVVAVVEQAREIATEEASLRIPSRLGWAVVLAAVTLMGWGVMRSTRAQVVPNPTLPATPPADGKRPAPPPVPESVPAAPTDLPPPTADAVPEAPVPKLPDSSTIETQPGSPQAKPSPSYEITSGTTRQPAGENDDPEKNALAFIEQNRKVAEGQLKCLKEEEAKLRARLQKVEGGIKRWESLLAALEKSSFAASSKGLTLTDPRAPDSDSPADLSPAPMPPQRKPTKR